ncbi:unnamed protein product [marine sediment metagenome]|uniref:Uncharacterized protein n=1 Tax=marine sediment metagenome TaxID=412755 RepID=X0Z1I2_9ZZZZ
MELNILERLMLASILPEQGDIVTLKIVQDLKLALAFNEKEVADCEIDNKDKRVTWNPEKSEYVKEIPIGPKAMSIIIEELETRDKDKTLVADFISLYDKFMGE